jgi:diguanylate cyclase (GGDEF)-like protein
LVAAPSFCGVKEAVPGPRAGTDVALPRRGLEMARSNVSRNDTDRGERSFHSSLDIRKLQQLVVKDELTRLYNRRYFRHRLDEECRRSERHGRPLSLMMADVNDFKEVNDRFGHPMGDRVLVEIAEILTRSIRDIDIVCRYAGDEFVILLPDIDAEGCRGVAERIAAGMSRHPWEERLEAPLKAVSLSVGYAVFPEQAGGPDELVERADRALYRAKKLDRPFCAFDGGAEEEGGDRGGGVERKTPVVGQKRERKELDRILERAKAGNGQIVLIHGDHGVGKSELLGEVEARAALKGFVVLRGTCLLETRDVPFHCLSQAVRSCLNGGRKGQAPHGVPVSRIEEVDEILTFGKHGGAPHGSAETGLGEEFCQEEFRVFELFSSLLRTISSAQPLLVSLENLQWVDPSSVRLLRYVGRQIRDKRILICGTARDSGPGREKGAGIPLEGGIESLREENFLRRIPLRGLNEVEAYALIERMAPDRRVDASVKEHIYHLSEGNPLFIREIIHYLLRERRDLLEPAASWESSPLDEIIPPTLQDLFEQVLVHLDPEVESILSYAAVIGQEFDFNILMAISGRNEGYILDMIDEAVRKGLIREVDREEGDRYVFTPFIVGRVLYGRLGPEKRRVLHKKIGEILEVLHSKSLPAHAGILAHHFEKSGEYTKAIHYASLAGDRAREVYAHREAVAYYTKALDMIEETMVPYPWDLAASFYGKRGRRLFALGDYTNCMDDFRSMLTCSREAGRKDLEGRAMVYLSGSLLTRGKLDESLERAEAALEIGRDLKDRALMMLALSDLGGVNLYLGRHDAALANYRESLRLSRELKDERAITRNLSNIGVYHWFIGEYDEAVRHYRMAMKRIEKSGDKHLLALNLNNLGAVHYMLGRFSESIKAYQESIVLTREIKDKSLLAYNYNNLGEIYQVLGRVDLAAKYHGDAIRMVREVGERYVECDILRNIGVNCHLQGRTAESVRYLKNALRFARKVGKVNFMLSALFDLGRVWLEVGEAKKAAMISEELARLASEAGTPDAPARACYLQAAVLRADGDREGALAKLEEALDALPEAHNPILLWQAWALKADLAEGAEACDARRRAIEIVREIEAGLGSTELKESFRNLESVRSLLAAGGETGAGG